MSKRINYEYLEIDDMIPEKIKVGAVLKDRIIFKHIILKSTKKSSIIDPMTGKPVQKTDDLDRWGIRGEVVHVGPAVLEAEPSLKPGAKFFLEDEKATWGIVINRQPYGVTRLSNVLFVYEE